jgi:hypothetical protein
MMVKRLAKWAAFVLVGIFVLWFPITWFFFGSVHPCGVLTQRMRGRAQAYAFLEVSSRIRQNLMLGLYAEKEPPPVIDRGGLTEEAIQRYRRYNYGLPPARCLWLAIWWRWNSQEDPDYQSARKMDDDNWKRYKEYQDSLRGSSKGQQQRKTGKTATELLEEELGEQ